jgi:hypothetical protein
MAFDPAKLPKLQSFLDYFRSGYDGNSMTQEVYDAYKGDDMLNLLKEFDPDASWSYNDNTTGGGEGGPSGQGAYVLNYNASKLPKSKYGSFLDVKPVKEGTEVYDDKYTYDDENYGKVTHYKNVKKPKDPMWTKLAPLVVGMGGPMVGAALAGAGIGGAAGLTSAVTGSGMSGAAGGALGKGISGAVKALPGAGRSIAGGDWRGLAGSAAGMGLGMLGGMGGAVGNVAQGMSSLSRWLPVANAAYGMMRRK